MTKIIPFIDMDNDIWVIKAKEDLYDYAFHFDFLPNIWIKNEIKKYTKVGFEVGNLKVSTLHRYNYSLRHFFASLEYSNFSINTFEDITPKMVENFIWYLTLEVEKPSTRGVAFAALKHLIKYGQVFEIEGYPTKQLFDRTDFRMLKTEDTLKSMIIPDPVMEQIKGAVKELLHSKEEEQIILGCLVSICMNTGIRISEALMLHEDSLNRDFFGKPLLEIISEKNETDRFIAVRVEVVQAIEKLKKLTSEYRKTLDTKRLFVHYLPVAKRVDYLRQYYARKWLKDKLIISFGIRHSPEELYRLNFHQFRHTLATDMLANGMNPFEIQNYLGHESLHSTRLYAKIRKNKLTQEYKKLGFIGTITDKVENLTDVEENKIDPNTRLMAQLPDGVCARPIKEKVRNCKLPNACLFCPKFVTTPEFLEVHRNHLSRIKQDKFKYKDNHFIGTDYLLSETETALEDIISRLEGLVGISG